MIDVSIDETIVRNHPELISGLCYAELCRLSSDFQFGILADFVEHRHFIEETKMVVYTIPLFDWNFVCMIPIPKENKSDVINDKDVVFICQENDQLWIESRRFMLVENADCSIINSDELERELS